jgi:hypothetical protein
VTNKRMVAGRTTQERIAETFEAMRASGDRLTLTEFARRAQVGYSTLCHEYKGWADRIRKHRDGRTKRKVRNDSSLAETEVQELIDHLRKELALRKQEHEELRQRIPALLTEVSTLRQANARLRGVQIRIHESLVAALGEQRAEQILSRAVATLPGDQPIDTEGEPF